MDLLNRKRVRKLRQLLDWKQQRIDVLGGEALDDLASVARAVNAAIDEDGTVRQRLELSRGQVLLLATAIRRLEALVEVEHHEDLERRVERMGPPQDLADRGWAIKRAERVGEPKSVWLEVGLPRKEGSTSARRSVDG